MSVSIKLLVLPPVDQNIALILENEGTRTNGQEFSWLDGWSRREGCYIALVCFVESVPGEYDSLNSLIIRSKLVRFESTVGASQRPLRSLFESDPLGVARYSPAAPLVVIRLLVSGGEGGHSKSRSQFQRALPLGGQAPSRRRYAPVTP